jgi:type III secretion protein Q
MSDTLDSPDEGSSDEPIDTLRELDIPVRFEIETIAVPLAELEAIEPGYVIELATPVDSAAIRLTAYGQTIGHAQLVAVGDRLGARITRMVTRDEQQPSA